MNAIRCVGAEVHVREVPELETGEEQVKVRILRSAISTGTELYKLSTMNPGEESGLGYMASGVVVESRTRRSGLQEGNRVFIRCAHAEFGVRDAQDVFPIPDEMDLNAAAVSYWVVPALRGIHRMNPQIWDDLAVVGQGGIGLMGLQILRPMANRLVAVDVNSFRLKASRKLGADVCVNPQGEDLVQSVSRVVPDGPHAVLEASGKREGLRAALEIVRPRGRVVALRIDADLSGLNLERYMYRKDLQLISSGQPGMAPSQETLLDERPRLDQGAVSVFPEAWTFHRQIEASLEMIHRGLVKTEPTVSHEIGFEEAPEMYRMLSNRDAPPEVLGVVIRWDC